MLSCKRILKFVAVLCICGITFKAFAVDQAAREETSPPAEEGPLTTEQVPPINSMAGPPSNEVAPQKQPVESPAQTGQPANQALPAQQ